MNSFTFYKSFVRDVTANEKTGPETFKDLHQAIAVVVYFSVNGKR